MSPAEPNLKTFFQGAGRNSPSKLPPAEFSFQRILTVLVQIIAGALR